ncbi:MAG: bifunctional isocitrate dehydrogenase kinase/phosphatase [Xanthomonadales bacterium]|nr:bifunctional isocitrate dehydrogenase kinase/phosphatase [Xanthomonadales bacterium]
MIDDRPIAHTAAETIYAGFERYNAAFREITASSRRRFETRDWHGARHDAIARIDLYDQDIAQCIADLQALLGDALKDTTVWSAAKKRYAEMLGEAIDRELFKTYFNSLSRRIFGTVGVNPDIEFVAVDLGPVDHVHQQVSINRYPFDGALGATCRRLLEDYSVNAPWQDLGDCAAYVHQELRRQLAAHGGTGAIEHFELVEPLFFRHTRAFIVGRIELVEGQVPLMIALVHTEAGVAVDRVLTSPDAASILFSYSRSYFHADLETVGDTVVFLRKILPSKPIEEIYAALGRAKQGKTERYRGLYRHLNRSHDRFVTAPGAKGMVMAVFTLRDYDVVFKVIRDHFAHPKTVTHQDVLDNYRMVFNHNRAGRLVDAQEFKNLIFDRRRFDPEVLEELVSECANSVSRDGNQLIIHHLYIERQLRPLNLYLRDIDEWETRRVAIDYGNAIKDLARTDIFTGDMLLKNFGVSRHGRVIFYDYDELCRVTECRFRRMPKPRYAEEELSSEIWFEVAPEDVFPEQFLSFFGLTGLALEVFRKHHSDLLTPRFWKETQRRLRAGEIVDVPPYVGGRYP